MPPVLDAVTSCSAFVRGLVRRQLILFCCGLLVLASGPLFGAGEYQKARDGKTIIWNWTPKAGQPASWSGTRDKKNYANGFGDLTWYSPDGKVFGLFYGNMVHGKFEGAVNLHTGSRVSHAYFVNGERVTEWARGAARSKMNAPEQAIVERRRVETEKPAAKNENVEQSEPATTPVPRKEKPKIAKTQPGSPPVEPGSHSPDSDTRMRESVPAPTAGPSESQREVKESPADVSVNALAGPPSSLRANSIRESSLRKPERETESTPRPNRPLTESEVINVADHEARLQGFEVDNYERPTVDHSNVRGRWTLFYSLKKSESGSESRASFSVTVEDKTGKAEIRK